MMDISLELDSVCRVCLQENGEMLHIFGTAGEETAISLKIAQCSSIKLVAGINMPELICSPCYADLEMAYRFHTNCENSDAILKSFVQTAVLNEMVMNNNTAGNGPNCSNADRDFHEFIEETHTNADIKPTLEELQQPLTNANVADSDYEVEGQSATTAPSLMGDDPIIEDVEFDAVGRLKLKVLGEDQYVEYRMNAADVDLLINDTSTFQVVTNNTDHPISPTPAQLDEPSTSAAPASLETLQFTYCVPSDDLIEESAMTASNSAAEDNDDDSEQQQQQQIVVDGADLADQEPSPLYVLCDEDSRASSRAAPTPDDDSAAVAVEDATYSATGDCELDENGCEIFPIMAVKTNKLRLNGRSRKTHADGAEPKVPPRRAAADKPMKKCEICGNEYKFQHALDGHMRRHRNEKPYRCDICGKAFVINFELSRHMRTHNGHKPYACQFCDRKFSDFGSRVKHTRTHTGERPYPCEVCGKRFAYSHVLTNHMLTHTGVKRFSCEICDKRFSKSHHLKAHMNSHNRVRTHRGLMSGNRATATTSVATTSASYSSANPRPTTSNSPPAISILGDTTPFDPSEFILPDDHEGDDVDSSSAAEADAVAAAALHFDNALMSMGMSGQIITDVETGEKFVLDLSDLEEDEKATVHLIHFNASDLAGDNC